MSRPVGRAIPLLLGLTGACAPPSGTDRLVLLPLTGRPEAEDPTAVFDQNDLMAAASPLGDQVVFTSQRTGNFRLWAMNVDGTRQRQLTHGPGRQMQGSFSPDGQRIAYLDVQDDARWIAVIDADGSNRKLLTEAPRDWPIPVWSPDGSRILYHFPGASGTNDLWTIDPDGGEPELLLASPLPVRQGAWSPDGRRIVFASRHGDEPWEIYVADANGGQWTQLTDNQENDYTPSWSPAGDRIVFQSPRSGRWTIFTVKPDGSEQSPITSYPAQYDPVWSHDGSEIFFNSDRDGRRGIYLMSADGSYPRKLTNTDPGTFVAAVREVGVEAAAHLYREAHAQHPVAVYFYEEEVRYLGENFLEMGDVRRALTLLQLGAEAYPASASAHVSLADALLAAGRVTPAVESYRRVLALDPENDRVAARIEQLGAASRR